MDLGACYGIHVNLLVVGLLNNLDVGDLDGQTLVIKTLDETVRGIVVAWELFKVECPCPIERDVVQVDDAEDGFGEFVVVVALRTRGAGKA